MDVNMESDYEEKVKELNNELEQLSRSLETNKNNQEIINKIKDELNAEKKSIKYQKLIDYYFLLIYQSINVRY